MAEEEAPEIIQSRQIFELPAVKLEVTDFLLENGTQNWSLDFNQFAVTI